MHRPHSCRCRPDRMRHRRSRWNCHRFFCRRRRRDRASRAARARVSTRLSMFFFIFVFLQNLIWVFWAADGGTGAGGLDFKNKKGFCPTWDKSLASAIPPKLTSCDVHSLLRTIMRTPRITGGFPSDPTWENFPFKPPSEGHSHRCAPLRSHHPKLSWDALCCATLLPHRFVV